MAGVPPLVEASESSAQKSGDLDGRTFLVTGATGGIGLVTSSELVARGASVYMTGRTAQKAHRAAGDVRAASRSDRVYALVLELGDLDSVRACAQAFLRTGAPLHGLINNAGLGGARGLTLSGFELAFGTNHVGAFLLTDLLTDRLREAAPARVVNVASMMHARAEGIDYDAVRRRTHSRTGLAEYGVSKLANVLHAQELGRRLDGTGVTTYSLHPGEVATDIWRRVPWPIRPLMTRRMLSPAEGAQTTLYCATHPAVAEETGRYYESCHATEPSKVATPELAAELWDRSTRWVTPDA
jgi:NAD(P)-dependent dehydrogenase (short-subunit alcohol dehydrogenase family)